MRAPSKATAASADPASAEPASADPTSGADPTEAFKALGDPIRWSIVKQMNAVDELPCATLEDTLPVSKPTISYHTKILVQAGLVEVRKQGRNYFYTLRREVLRQVMDEIWTLAPEPRPVRDDGKVSRAPATSRRRRPVSPAQRGKRGEKTSEPEVTLLTW